jgi:hypothetical protein
MLLSKCLLSFLRLHATGVLVDMPESLTTTQVPLILVQICVRLLQEQHLDGFWESPTSYEATAYGLLALKAVFRFAWPLETSFKIHNSIMRATAFLKVNVTKWHQAAHIWIEKVTYCSPLLSRAYCIAALSCPFENGDDRLQLHHVHPQAVQKYKEFLQVLPLFASTNEWLLQISIVESCLFMEKLTNSSLDIFPASQNIHRTPISGDHSHNMDSDKKCFFDET